MRDQGAPDWGRWDYRAWRESPVVQLMPWHFRGCYFLLLDIQWRIGYVPADPMACARLVGVQGDDELAGFLEAVDAVVGQFDPDPDDGGKLRNERQAYERDRAIRYFEQKRQAGKSNTGKKKERTLERTSERTTERKSNAPPIELDVDLEQMYVVPSLRSVTTPSGAVENSELDVHERLGPLARRLYPATHDQTKEHRKQARKEQSKWIAWGKCQRSVDAAEEWMGGLAIMKERGMLEWIEPDEPVTVKVFERFPQIRPQAEAAWAQHGPGADRAAAITKGLIAI